MTADDYTIREALRSEFDGILALLPRLAEFERPAWREAKHCWQDDEALLRRWLNGEADQCLVHVAVSPERALAGVTIVQLRPDMFTQEPGAHLDVLLVSREAEGTGLGSRLLRHAEDLGREHGAKRITLHVLSHNHRAIATYERNGFESELIRYAKPLQP